MATQTLTTPPIQLSSLHLGIVTGGTVSPSALEECDQLPRKNHEVYHIFFRDTAGHNHIVHSLLTILSLGASPQELQDRYDDSGPIQREMPEIDHALLSKLADPDTFYNSLGLVARYHTFLEFFKREIAATDWRSVVQIYVFARTKLADTMLARMYEGADHPIIHLGLGIEFSQPCIVAEALAQAAAHDKSNSCRLRTCTRICGSRKISCAPMTGWSRRSSSSRRACRWMWREGTTVDARQPGREFRQPCGSFGRHD